MSNIEVIPVFGTSFLIYVPLITIIISLITLFNGYSRICQVFGIEAQDLSSSGIYVCQKLQLSDEDVELYNSGKKIVMSELKRLKSLNNQSDNVVDLHNDRMHSHSSLHSTNNVISDNRSSYKNEIEFGYLRSNNYSIFNNNEHDMDSDKMKLFNSKSQRSSSIDSNDDIKSRSLSETLDNDSSHSIRDPEASLIENSINNDETHLFGWNIMKSVMRATTKIVSHPSEIKSYEVDSTTQNDIDVSRLNTNTNGRDEPKSSYSKHFNILVEDDEDDTYGGRYA